MAAERHNPDDGGQPEEVTLADVETASFSQAATSLRLIGLLRPADDSGHHSIRIEGDRLLVGRDPNPDDGCAVAILADEGVSREHAEITRENDDFVVRDLSSRNGTYVDGIPVVSCVLRDGDTIQIGRYKFHFDRLKQLLDWQGGDLA